MNWDAIIQEFLPSIVRLAIIVFSTLGVVYMCGRLLWPTLKDRGKNRIAFVTLIIISYVTTLVWDFPWLVYDTAAYTLSNTIDFMVQGFIFSTISAVFYIVLAWRFYPRVDALLDKKFGKDDRRKK